MHTHILEQIATIDSQVSTDQIFGTNNHAIQSTLSRLSKLNHYNCSGSEECICFLEPETENVSALIQPHHLTAEIVVLNSDIGYLAQIYAYLNNPANLKAAFIITTDEARNVECWNIDMGRAGQIYNDQFKSGFHADHLTYDYSILLGEFPMKDLHEGTPTNSNNRAN